jgi:hypothetical protein
MNPEPGTCEAPAPIRARNKRAYEAAQELHAAVRTIVTDLICPCCHRPPPAKQVKAKLPPHLQRDDRTINSHIRSVLKEHRQ